MSQIYLFVPKGPSHERGPRMVHHLPTPCGYRTQMATSEHRFLGWQPGSDTNIGATVGRPSDRETLSSRQRSDRPGLGNDVRIRTIVCETS
jgi:hypothetical protein